MVQNFQKHNISNNKITALGCSSAFGLNTSSEMVKKLTLCEKTLRHIIITPMTSSQKNIYYILKIDILIFFFKKINFYNKLILKKLKNDRS
jgi:hypothetical protein